MRKEQNVDEHINRISSLFQRMLDLGDTHLSEQWKANFLLVSLPKKYESINSEIGKKPENELTWSAICANLLENQNIRSQPSSSHELLNQERERAITQCHMNH